MPEIHHREIAPKEYTRRYLPVGAKVKLMGSGWVDGTQDGSICVVTDRTTSDGEIYVQDIQGNLWFVEKEYWSCVLILPEQFCMRCRQDFFDDESHYLCRECRL